MKYPVFLTIVLLLCSCDDGDLQIEAVNFDDVSLSSCDSSGSTETTFFFKIDGDEALLLELSSGLLENSTSLDGSIQDNISSSGTPQLIYRLFTDDVSSSYFCDEVPPLEPTVLVENLASAGDLTILSNVGDVTASAKNYNHNITLTNLTLNNDQNERLTDTSTLEYGDFTTTATNSPSLESPFSNYNAIAVVICETSPSDNTVRLYKPHGDEYILLDVPTSLFSNSVTESGTPRTDTLGETSAFQNVVLNALVAEDAPCSSTSEETLVGTFTATEGTVEVTTVASAPDAEGIITYTHTITLTNITLQLQKPGEDSTTDLSEITSFVFGSLATTGS
ncbi:MAG: hypothetical protein AAGA86_04145 [Bacteroidota bacterium]